MCERMKISGVQKLVPNLFHKNKYVIHIATLKQALKHEARAGLAMNSLGNRVRPRHMVSTIHRVQHPTSNQGKEQLQEGLLQAHQQLSAWEDNGEGSIVISIL